MAIANSEKFDSTEMNERPSAITSLSLDQLTPATLYQQFAARVHHVWPALQLIAAAAEEKGWSLYVVGGAVRDLLLSLSGEASYPLVDIDLVVEGAETGAGVTLAESVQASYPQAKLQVYGNFQTAALTLPIAPDSEPLLIDIATARTETYAYPAANPDVESSTLQRDLYRRDFTINAMAIRLNGVTPGQLVDLLNGVEDLRQRSVRVLHAKSFIDDPTRIFRAVRFVTRLNFDLEPQTESYILQATGSELYRQLQLGDRKVPALQGRLKAEIQYLLSSAQWQQALTEIDRLGALVCLHPNLKITSARWCQLRRMQRWLNKIEVGKFELELERRLPVWSMQLELLLAQLTPADAVSTAKRLTLDDKSQHRLENLHQWESHLIEQLSRDSRPSWVYQLFKAHQLAEMLLMAARYPYTLAPYVWQYISQLSEKAPLINGATLKRLGYSPGPNFREILSEVHRLYLDGALGTVADAEAYVVSHYGLDT